MRKRYVEDCNRILGTNIEVDYGCAWKHFKEGEVSADEFINDVLEREENKDEKEKRSDGKTEEV